MKKEKDTENFSEKMKAKGWREVDRSKVPRPKQPKATSDVKSRITIYLDADIVSYFKEMAKDSGRGYQTLINQSLREIVDKPDRLKNFNEATEIYKRSLAINKKDTKTLQSLAITFNSLAIAYQAQGKHDEAIELFNKALSIYLDLDIKREILQDKDFLHELKDALVLKR